MRNKTYKTKNNKYEIRFIGCCIIPSAKTQRKVKFYIGEIEKENNKKPLERKYKCYSKSGMDMDNQANEIYEEGLDLTEGIDE